MARHRIKVAITGRGATPELVPIEVLAETLAHVGKAVLANLDPCLELPEGATIGLVAIEESSDGLVLSVPDRLVPTVALISQAIDNEDFSGLSEPGVSALRNLSSTLEKHEWSFQVAENREHDIRHVRIEYSHLPPPPDKGVPIRGSTTVFGRCLRVGGAKKPKAEIRSSSTGEILYADLSEEIAKELGKLLYEEVILEGAAVWDSATWQIQEFRISRVTAYRQTDPVLAFKELSEASHGKWGDVDAPEYVRSLRSENR
jgi:hypothetical protein